MTNSSKLVEIGKRQVGEALMDPSCSSGSSISSKHFQTKSFKRPFQMFTKVTQRDVNLASGQVLGTFASDCSVVRPPASGSPATSSLV